MLACVRRSSWSGCTKHPASPVFLTTPADLPSARPPSAPRGVLCRPRSPSLAALLACVVCAAHLCWRDAAAASAQRLLRARRPLLGSRCFSRLLITAAADEQQRRRHGHGLPAPSATTQRSWQAASGSPLRRERREIVTAAPSEPAPSSTAGCLRSPDIPWSALRWQAQQLVTLWCPKVTTTPVKPLFAVALQAAVFQKQPFPGAGRAFGRWISSTSQIVLRCGAHYWLQAHTQRPSASQRLLNRSRRLLHHQRHGDTNIA